MRWPAAGSCPTSERQGLVRREQPMGVRCPRRSIVVCVGADTSADEAAKRMTRSLEALGVETKYFGRQEDALGIATLVVEARADAVELCIGTGTAGVVLLRQLLRRLIEIGRR